MQPLSEIEEHAKVPDAWAYTTTPDDQIRKNWIIGACKFMQPFGQYEKALDVGAYEGWLTKDLPAKIIHGYEISNNAAARFPKNVTRVKDPTFWKYDLIISTGTLYPHYDWPAMLDLIARLSTNIIVICGVRDWLVPDCELRLGKPLFEMQFPYRENLTQRLMVWKKTSS